MWKNREFKVGDEVVDSNFGYGKVDVIKTAYLEVLFLSGERQCYFFDGRIGKPCLYPSLFHPDNIPFELAGKYLEMQQAGKQHPTETPTPKINRAELLEVASRSMQGILANKELQLAYYQDIAIDKKRFPHIDNFNCIAVHAVSEAKELINEVDKEVENGK